MAERRMFAKTIVDSDAFLEMPISARLLYYDLGMRADDDGFVNSPKKIMRIIGATNDDMNILIMRKFIIPFDNGIVVIKHWRINNYLRNDRYKETTYLDEKHQLEIDKRGNYHLKNEDGIPSGIPLGIPAVGVGKDSIGKVSIDKDSLGKDSIENVCTEPSQSSAPETALDAPAIPLIDGSEWRPVVNDLEEWQKFYTGVDVIRELGRMRQWCLGNPTKRKTPKGVRRFVTAWLDREQNRQKRPSGSDKYTDRINAVDSWGTQYDSN